LGLDPLGCFKLRSRNAERRRGKKMGASLDARVRREQFITAFLERSWVYDNERKESGVARRTSHAAHIADVEEFPRP